MVITNGQSRCTGNILQNTQKEDRQEKNTRQKTKKINNTQPIEKAGVNLGKIYNYENIEIQFVAHDVFLEQEQPSSGTTTAQLFESRIILSLWEQENQKASTG